jgi:hypothetical protein
MMQQRSRKLRCRSKSRVNAAGIGQCAPLFSEPYVIGELAQPHTGGEPIGPPDDSPAIAGSMFRGMIDLDRLARCYRLRWQGCRLCHVLGLV